MRENEATTLYVWVLDLNFSFWHLPMTTHGPHLEILLVKAFHLAQNFSAFAPFLTQSIDKKVQAGAHLGKGGGNFPEKKKFPIATLRSLVKKKMQMHTRSAIERMFL